MGMYTYYIVKITGNTKEIGNLYTELNCLKKVYEDSKTLDEDSAKTKDNQLIDTIFYYGLEKDEITKCSYSYSDSITWEKISYEYYLYQKFKTDPPKTLFNTVQDTYYFSLKTLELDYGFKKSLEHNNIRNIDDYFHFYEKDYDKKLDFQKLKQSFGDNTYTFSRWWCELLYPLLIGEIQKADREITLEFEYDYNPNLLFERLSKLFDVLILVSYQYEEDHSPTYSYYYKGDEIDKKTYKERITIL